MGSYNYKCADCKNVFGIESTLEEKEAGTGENFFCPACKSKKIESHFSPSNFFKNVFFRDSGCGCSDGGCCGGEEKKMEDDCCADSKEDDCCSGHGKGGCCS